jgi:iron complex outermembrane receptor protein
MGATALTAVAAPALAQSDREWGISEIVVTAQKREQRLQDVPTSVTALTAESLTMNRIQNVSNLDSVSPSLTVTTVPAGNTGPQYSMRGVLATGTAPGADKGVALYIDGVYIGTASGSAFNMADIERIEVLKGPQGTLFGRNSTGGAISIVTRGPRGELHVKQELTFGNYDQFQSRTRIDTPQMGPFSAAVTYAHSERRGEIRNTGAGTVWNGATSGLSSHLESPEHLGDDDSDSWAAALKFDVTPDFNLVYKFDHTNEDLTEQGVGQLAFIFPTLTNANIASGSPNVVSKDRPETVNNWATVPSNVKATGHVLTANWRVNDSLNVKNIVAYRKGSYYAPLNMLYGMGGLFAGGVPFLPLITNSAGHDSQWSEELQVDYDSKLLHLTTGGLWYRQKNSKGAGGTGFNSFALRTAPGFVIPAPPTPTQQSDVTVRSYAVYAQGEFHVMDTLDAVLGARYTDDKKRGVDRTIPRIGTLDYDGDKWTYNLGLNYKPNNDILIYGKYATGYISGGRLTTLDYQPETAKSLEAGLKADWLEHRLRTNVAVYSAKYGSLQYPGSGSTFGVPDAAQVLVNAGDAKAKGVELELTAVPVRAITLGANVSYLDFKFTRLDPRFTAAGNSLPAQRPKWVANLSAEYESPPVVGDARFHARVDGNFRSEHDGGSMVAFRDLTRIPESWVVNARVGLDDLDLGPVRGSLAVWAHNVFDEGSPRYILGTPLAVAAIYERARTVGVDFTVEY